MPRKLRESIEFQTGIFKRIRKHHELPPSSTLLAAIFDFVKFVASANRTDGMIKKAID